MKHLLLGQVREYVNLSKISDWNKDSQYHHCKFAVRASLAKQTNSTAMVMASCLFSLLSCTTMNMPLHSYHFDRDINTQWTQTVSFGDAGIQFDTAQRLAGFNSQSLDFSYMNYVLPMLGVGARVSAYAPYSTLMPSRMTGADAWWSYYTYVVPISFILSARLLHTKFFTFGFNVYPVSWPFIIGSVSMIGTFHLFWNLDLSANLHCNPTLAYVLDWKSDYAYFNEYDVALTHSIRLGTTPNKLFYSLAFESYRGVYVQNADFYGKTPDWRIGINVGYLFGSATRRFGQVHGDKDWFYTWPQSGHKD
jgi:hypothetical protein